MCGPPKSWNKPIYACEISHTTRAHPATATTRCQTNAAREGAGYWITRHGHIADWMIVPLFVPALRVRVTQGHVRGTGETACRSGMASMQGVLLSTIEGNRVLVALNSIPHNCEKSNGQTGNVRVFHTELMIEWYEIALFSTSTRYFFSFPAVSSQTRYGLPLLPIIRRNGAETHIREGSCKLPPARIGADRLPPTTPSPHAFCRGSSATTHNTVPVPSTRTPSRDATPRLDTRAHVFPEKVFFYCGIAMSRQEDGE